MNGPMSDATFSQASKQLLAAGLVGLTLLGAAGCAAMPPPPTAAPVVDAGIVRLAQPSAGYTLEPSRRDADGELRVLVYYDMEGLSGQDDWRTYLFRYPEQYRRGQKLLAADVNAVIDGLFAGGANQVHVVDGHSSGNPEPDLRPELLDRRAHQVLRDEPFDAYTGLVEAGVYDAVAVVGMHAKSGSRGFASHTGFAGTQLLLEGQSITETELLALSWGRVGVPVIFASGDDVLREDLSTMPWLEYVTVKEAVSADSARLRPVGEARVEMREGAKRAAESLSRMRVMRPERPLHAAVRAIPPADLSALEGLPGITYDDGKVSFVAPDFQAAYDGWLALMRVASAGYVGVLFEVLADHPAGEEILDDAWARHFALWFDVESGRWNPPPPEPEARRKYHGYP
jgi:D-amino peptidase